MESLPTATERQLLISSFLEIAVGQNAETAIQFLQATSWKLEEAIQLFYVGNDVGGAGLASASASELPPVDQNSSGVESVAAYSGDGKETIADEVRAPLPVKRDTLYGDAAFLRQQPSSVVAFRNFEEESRRPAVWESEQNTASTANGGRDNLASLYRPPFALMYNGSFDKAKFEASLQDKWLLVNLQSTEEFSSHMLNRDTWSNEAVTQTIRTNFIFWQAYNDTSEGRKVCTYYNLSSIPVILVIDPITGQKMREWTGMVQPEPLLEDLLPFMEGGPKQQHVFLPLKRRREGAKDSTVSISATEKYLDEDEELLMAVAASLEGSKVPVESSVDEEAKADEDSKSSANKEPVYPPLPEEPKGNRELLCRVGIRLPDGRRVQRSFLRSDSIRLLWSFCSSQLEGAAARPFHFTEAIPGASKTLEYESNITFDEAGLSNSMISMLWD